MARNSVSSTVLEASRVLLSNTIKLHAVNTYTLSSNFISWDASNSYNIEDIAQSFGTRYTGAPTEVVGGMRDAGFTCGAGAISAFDFGLLYTVFTAMVMAKVELGTTFPVLSEKLQRQGTWVAWFGNDAVVYSAQDNLIIPLKNADVELVCGGEKVKVSNFCSRDVYTFEREGRNFYVLNAAGELLLSMAIPECVAKTYAVHFRTANSGTVVTGDGSWDEGSGLGSLIGTADTRSECLDVLEKYKMSPPIASVVSRDDLVVVPTERYADTTNFFGSVCFTDKQEIAIAVNFRRGLFVYYPWFVADTTQEREVKVDPSAKFPEFYNVTEGCNRILRYAGTVNNRPLTSAQMDAHVFDTIKNAFLEMRLSRIPIQSSFGRVVIPEEVLLQELIGGTGESLFCMVPVGIIGPKLVCLTAQSVLSSITPSGWELSSAFYDITEVIQ